MSARAVEGKSSNYPVHQSPNNSGSQTTTPTVVDERAVAAALEILKKGQGQLPSTSSSTTTTSSSVPIVVDEKAVAAALKILQSQGQSQLTSSSGEVELKLKYGSKYVGEVKDGKPHGHGVINYSGSHPDHCKSYDGEFENGQRTNGTLHLTDGSVFTGKFTNDEYSSGTFISPELGKYVGTFKDGSIVNGTRTFKLGLNTQTALFENGKPFTGKKNGRKYDSGIDITGYSSGCLIS